MLNPDVALPEWIHTDETAADIIVSMLLVNSLVNAFSFLCWIVGKNMLPLRARTRSEESDKTDVLTAAPECNTCTLIVFIFLKQDEEFDWGHGLLVTKKPRCQQIQYNHSTSTLNTSRHTHPLSTHTSAVCVCVCARHPIRPQCSSIKSPPTNMMESHSAPERDTQKTTWW